MTLPDLLAVDRYVDGLNAARDHIAGMDHTAGLLDRDTVLAELRDLIDETVFGHNPQENS